MSHDAQTSGCLQDTWGRIQWLWEQPVLKQMRITLSMAQWTVRLPALLALVATQMGFLASQVHPRHPGVMPVMGSHPLG